MNSPNTTSLRVGILTVSDRASSGEYEDRGGPAIAEWLTAAIASPWDSVTHLVPDDQQLIESALRTLVDDGCQLVFTTGGTGPAPRDVTPEATLAVASAIRTGRAPTSRQGWPCTNEGSPAKAWSTSRTPCGSPRTIARRSCTSGVAGSTSSTACPPAGTVWCSWTASRRFSPAAG